MIQLSNPSIIDIKKNNSSKVTGCQNNGTPVAFKGVVDVATQALNYCDKYPMLNVSAIDAVTAILPRTFFDAQTNGFAAFETFRRESSGLVVNCLLPGFIVLGMGKLLNRAIFKDGNFKMGSVWANQHSIETLADYYNNAQGATPREKLHDYVRSVIRDVSCVDAKDTVHYADPSFDFSRTIENLVDAIQDDSKVVKKTVHDAYKDIVEQTRAAEILKLKNEPLGANLTSLLDNIVELGRRFSKEGVNLESFKKNATCLVNAKSLAGFAVIIPLAMSMQSINRWITKKVSGKEGAPIYKDFAIECPHDKKVEHDKENLKRNKLLAITSMLAVAVASMAKMPSVGMFQFKGLFPTMDQCRWISASTFCSRMAVSEDNNELRETFFRDTITFASLYWLGDYASKLTAKAFEKLNPELKLLNHSVVSSEQDSTLRRVGNWIRHTRLKSFDEVSSKAKNARTLSQLAGFGFSTLILGWFLPKYTRMQTEKKEREFREMQIQRNTENIKNMFHLSRKSMPVVFQKFTGSQN